MRYLTIGVIAFAMTACATVGTDFNHQNRDALQLGVTTPEEAIRLLGEPSARDRVTVNGVEYVRMKYQYVTADPSGSVGRTAGLEFKDGVLTSKIYMSGFEEDSTAFAYNQHNEIVRNVTTTEQAIALLGAPSGIATCPSTMDDFKSVCETDGVTSVLMWFHLAKMDLPGFGKVPEPEITTVTLGFDKNDIVTDVKASPDFSNPMA